MESLIDYSRQNEFTNTFQAQLGGWHHAIIGCGGVGFWLGILLAMQGYNNFALFDGQRLEASNMNRIPVPPQWLGTKKVTALRKIIKQLRPETNIVNFPNHITEENLDILGRMIGQGGMNFIIWDCTDDARIQRKVYDWSRTNNIRYRKIGYEGFKMGSYKNYDVWTAADYAPGYRTSNACASSSVFAAVLGFMAQGLGIEGDLNLDIRDMLVTAQKPVEEIYTPSPQGGEITGIMVDEAQEIRPEQMRAMIEGIPAPHQPVLTAGMVHEALDRAVAFDPGMSLPVPPAVEEMIRREQQRQEEDRRRRHEDRLRNMADSIQRQTINNPWVVANLREADEE